MYSFLLYIALSSGAYTQAHASTHKRTQAHASTRKHTQAHASTRKHTQAHVSTHKRTQAHASTRKHTQAHASTRKHAHVSARKHTYCYFSVAFLFFFLNCLDRPEYPFASRGAQTRTSLYTYAGPAGHHRTAPPTYRKGAAQWLVRTYPAIFSSAPWLVLCVTACCSTNLRPIKTWKLSNPLYFAFLVPNQPPRRRRDDYSEGNLLGSCC